jgi:hypothetical protein
MIGRQLVVAGLVGGLLLGPAAALAVRQQGEPGVTPLRVGEIVKVSGTPIGCVVRRQAGERVLDCRRFGPLMGSYGTILSRTRALVVRFDSKTSGTIVFTAHHRSLRTRTCGVQKS